ncbi:hypothetical protein D9M68_877190 [compost metagenome]
MVDDGLAADISPQEAVQAAALVHQPQVGLRVGNGRRHLELVAHDAGIGQQLGHLVRAVRGDLARVPVVESGAVAFALVQDGFPAQPGLCAFEIEHLEQAQFVVARQAPLFVVVGDVFGIGGIGPAAAV